MHFVIVNYSNNRTYHSMFQFRAMKMLHESLSLYESIMNLFHYEMELMLMRRSEVKEAVASLELQPCIAESQ